MKKFQFLALKSSEFCDMVEVIARDRKVLRIKNRNENMIKLACFMIIPISTITFKIEKDKGNLNVTRSINFLPIILLSIPAIAFLEAIVYGIAVLTENFQSLSFILIGCFWLMVIVAVIYQTYVEVDEINRKLYRVEV